MSNQRVFRALSNPNYRLWASGAIVSNVGTWMQRTAQDWLVLTELTHNNATAMGIVMALQFAPQILLLPLTGYAADAFNRRKVLFATQGLMGLLALGLGTLCVTGLVQLWHVYVFALLLGCVAAFDTPARQTFVSEIVGEADLANAVALNSTSFNAGRLLGPAVAGALIAALGTGPVFLLNAVSFGGVLISILMLRADQLQPATRLRGLRGNLGEGFRYIWARADLRTIFLMMFMIGTFGLNFPIFISTMSVQVFHADSRAFGFLTSAMAVGSITGALLAARRERPRLELLAGGAALFGFGFILASLAPSYFLFAAFLVVIGVAAQTFTTSTNSLVQLSTDPAMRGRVLAILFAIALGGTTIGGPIVGAAADHLGPRAALIIGALAGLSAAALGFSHMLRMARHQRSKDQTDTLDAPNPSRP